MSDSEDEVPKGKGKRVAEEDESASAGEDEDDSAASEDEGKKSKKKTKTAKAGDKARKGIDIGNNKRVTVDNFKGKMLVNIREYYEDKKSGEMKPGKKGIALTEDQWEALTNPKTLAEIEAALN